MKKLLIILGLLLVPSLAFAQFTVPQGGTGSTTVALGQLLFGQGSSLPGSLRLGSASGLTFATSSNTLSTVALTLSGTLTTSITGTNNNCLQVNSSGVVSGTGAACGGSDGVGNWFTPTTYAGITVNSTSTPIWFKATSPYSLIATSSLTDFASTTIITSSLASTTNLRISAVPAALVVTGSGGLAAAYAGASCTNQFPRSQSAIGAWTCASVANTDLTNSSVTINTSGNLQGGGTVALGAALNLSSAFSFTPTTNFGTTANSTSTLMLLTAGLTASSTTNAIRFGIAGAQLSLIVDTLGRVGFGTSTPLATAGITISTTTLMTAGQFSTGIASTSASDATYTVNWDNCPSGAGCNTQRFILNQNAAFVINATSSNPRDGAKYLLKICQDGTGNRTATFVTPGQLNWSAGTTSISLTANTATWIGLIYDGRTQRYDIVASTTVATGNACVI